MNPFDAIGTARVSQAIADRICRVVLGYQDAAAEQAITTAVTGENGHVTEFAVTLTRATRAHRDVRMGASVRGAIDLVLLLTGLTRLRGARTMTRDTARVVPVQPPPRPRPRHRTADDQPRRARVPARRVRPDERVTVLQSDCLRTAGGDPAAALTGIDRLHVVCPLPTPESERAAAALARRGGGISAPVRSLAQVAPALTRALAQPA